jgi:hypothetical protein
MKVNGTKGALVILGLGHPLARAFVVSTVVGLIAFTAGMPKSAFTAEGELRPQKGLSSDPEATDVHFLAVPLSAAILTVILT